MARVLVISADPSMRLLWEHILRTAGHTITLAETNIESEMVAPSAVNAVLIDLDTPNGDLLSSIAALRTRWPHVPILAIAGEDQPLNFLELRMNGADDVLKHPVSPTALVEAVKRALEEAS